MGSQVQKNYLNEVQILEHFMEMERRFKRNTERPFFPSLDYFLDDDVDRLRRLKTQVENMVHFVGLGSKPIKMKLEKLDGAAAYISLSDMSVVDITIDEDEYKDNNFDRIFGALAHELGHFVLKSHGLWFNQLLDIENEVYADLSTFYLGFGKFVLRGFLVGNPIGYLTPETYIWAYVISEYLCGRAPDRTALPDKIINQINTATAECKTKWIRNVKSEQDLKEEYKKLSIPVGTTFSIFSILENVIKNEATLLGRYINQLSKTCLTEADNSPLDCRKAAIAYYTFLNRNSSSFLAQEHLSKFIEFLALMQIEKFDYVKKVYETVDHKCPYCGTIINNPAFDEKEGKRIFHIRCKKCQTQFVVNNDLPHIQSRIKERVSHINSLVPFYSDEHVVARTIKYLHEKNEKLESQNAALINENANLKDKIKKWRSLNWWQRLWYKDN